MKLVDLNPRFIGSGGEGVSSLDPATGRYVPAPRREGVGIILSCPCGNVDEDHELFVPFKVALDGSPSPHLDHGWDRTGDTFETLTLTPSILRSDPNGCRWHGYITNGEVRTV